MTRRFIPHTERHLANLATDTFAPEDELPAVERFPLWTVVTCLIAGLMIATGVAVVLP